MCLAPLDALLTVESHPRLDKEAHMRVRISPAIAGAFTGALLASACSDHGIMQIEEPHLPQELSTGDSTGSSGELVLLNPSEGGLVTQNDPTIACPYHQHRGYGFQIEFDWADADVALGPVIYFVHAKKETAQYPILQHMVGESELTFLSCNGFVIDRNLDGWWWYVAALDTLGNVVASSDTSHFAFLPCRHDDGRACAAPATGVAPAFSHSGVE